MPKIIEMSAKPVEKFDEEVLVSGGGARDTAAEGSGASQKYELTCISLESDPVSEKDASEIVGSAGGKIVTISNLGVKNFAYQIGKIKRGFYGAVKFQATPEALKEIEKTLKLNKKVIRYLIVKDLRMPPPRPRVEIVKPKKEAKPAAKAAAEPEAKEETKAKAEGAEKPEPEKIKAVKVPEPEEAKTPAKPTKPKLEFKKVQKPKKPVEKKQKISRDELDRKLEELIQE